MRDGSRGILTAGLASSALIALLGTAAAQPSPPAKEPVEEQDEPPPVDGPAEEQDEPPPFELLRYDEDHSYLRDLARRTGNLLALEPLKYLPFDDAGDVYLSLGGEIRLRYEFYDDRRFGRSPEPPDGYLLQRYLLHGDLHLGASFRTFLQLRGAFTSFRDGPPVPTNADGFDVQQAFFDVGTGRRQREPALLTLRVGRQELSYGTERLVSVREATNVHRAFDAARALGAFAGWRVDGFFGRLVQNEIDRFDPWFQRDTNFWGVYGTGAIWSAAGMNLDVYYLGVERPDAAFDQGTARELRHTFGARLFGELEGLEYDLEGMYQGGEFGAHRIRAWAAASDAGYTFRTLPLSPRIGARANVASGDQDPRDRTLGTFNPLFPRGNYFGESAIVGPVNLFDVHPLVQLSLLESLVFEAGWAIFWRYSTADGFYDNRLDLIQAADGSERRLIGSELSLVLDWTLGRHLSARGSYSHFFTGPFLKDTGPGSDANAVIVFGAYHF